MTNWTQEREVAVLCVIEIRAALVTLPQIEQDLFDAIHETQRLREELIGAWTHKLSCPCAPRISTKNTNVAPLKECTCGLDEALYAHPL